MNEWNEMIDNAKRQCYERRVVDTYNVTKSGHIVNSDEQLVTIREFT